MTTAHVEKFAELVAKDPALLAKLGLDKVNEDAAAAAASAAAAAASAAAFITNAVKEAKALGLEFTDEELISFMVAERLVAGSGELSDTQLEAVVGGHANPDCPPREDDYHEQRSQHGLTLSAVVDSNSEPWGNQRNIPGSFT
jgi:hypothetical protein